MKIQSCVQSFCILSTRVHITFSKTQQFQVLKTKFQNNFTRSLWYWVGHLFNNSAFHPKNLIAWKKLFARYAEFSFINSHFSAHLENTRIHYNFYLHVDFAPSTPRPPKKIASCNNLKYSTQITVWQMGHSSPCFFPFHTLEPSTGKLFCSWIKFLHSEREKKNDTQTKIIITQTYYQQSLPLHQVKRRHELFKLRK